MFRTFVAASLRPMPRAEGHYCCRVDVRQGRSSWSNDDDQLTARKLDFLALFVNEFLVVKDEHIPEQQLVEG